MWKKIILIVIIVLAVGLIGVGAVLGKKQADLEKAVESGVTSRDENKEANKGRNDAEEIEEVQIEGEPVTSNYVNLSDYASNIIISEAGEYFLSGNFNNSIYVDSNSAVTLNLNGVNVNAGSGAAIANVGTSELIINVVGGTNNVLSNGKEASAHDGCVFSKGPINIKGNGNLKVYGNQSDGEGIATKSNSITIGESNISIYSVDDGINTGGDGGTVTINSGVLYIESGGDAIDSNKDVVINGGLIEAYAGLNGINSSIDVDDKYVVNGGTILATGTDRLTLPDKASTGKVLCFEVVDAIKKGQSVALVNESGNVVFSLNTRNDINTIFYASNNLLDGKYYLYTGGVVENNKYVNGNLISIKKNTEYLVNGNINSYIE